MIMPVDLRPAVPRHLQRQRAARATYDAAQTNAHNRKHWANADLLDAASANSPSVRAILRKRARYEVANNSYAKGIVLTLANDVIGTGPRLQLLSDDPSLNRLLEAEFASWSLAVNLAAKLRTMRMAKATDGEAFAAFIDNRLNASDVLLDLRLIEADQVAAPWSKQDDGGGDGISYDADGNPTSYTVLKDHPGASGGLAYGAATKIPATQMLHLFGVDRPGQLRGVPDITPAVPLFALLRRFTLATTTAAETAADFSVIMNTSLPPESGCSAHVPPTSEMEIVRNMMVYAPEGWEPTQMKPEQPAATYEMFKRELVNEIARCLNMPYNVAAGNSSRYNYASGRLDHQTYFKAIRVEQQHIETVVLDRILGQWLLEASLLKGLGRIRTLPHQWFWNGDEHVDPLKEANAQETRLSCHTTTLAAEYARQGRDWEAELEQRGKELELMARLGLTQAPGDDKTARDDTADQDEEEANHEA